MMTDSFERLIPLPRRIARLEGLFTWDSPPRVVLEKNDDDLRAAETLRAACATRRLPEPHIVTSPTEPGDPAEPLILAGDPCRHLPLLRAMEHAGMAIVPELGSEGYLLQITPRLILVAGNTPAAVYYGFQTLIQLLPADGGPPRLPCALIQDWPDMRQRGISMDIARGEVSTPKTIETEITRIAHYKMNFLLLYIEDAFEFASHPDIGENRDRLTADDARRLDRFARNHHVMLCPCVDSPGHMERLLRLSPYARLAEGTESPSLQMVINVSHPETYPLLRRLYGDICDAFSCPLIHIGGDEAVALGTGASRPEAERFGAKRLFARHLKELRAFMASRGRRIICWADPFEPNFFKPFGIENYGIEGMTMLPRDILLSSWHYGRIDDFPFGEQAAAMGFELQLMTSMGAHELFPELELAAENVETFTPFARKPGVLGVVHSNWGDVNSFREYTWPANAHFAEWAWRPGARPWAQLLPIAAESFFGPGAGDLASVCRCLGDARKYFGWAVIGIGMPINKVFFDPIGPCKLGAERKSLLYDYRQRCRAARETFDRVRPIAARETETLDYIDFAIDQFSLLTDIAECRHLLAVDPGAAALLLEKLAEELPLLARRYEQLWNRARMPKGLGPNTAKFANLIESVLQKVSYRFPTPGAQ
ncbi:MAG: family 20 glycosylhydrolase [bacterium]